MATVRFSREEIDQVKEITAEDTVTVIRYLQHYDGNLERAIGAIIDNISIPEGNPVNTAWDDSAWATDNTGNVQEEAQPAYGEYLQPNAAPSRPPSRVSNHSKVGSIREANDYASMSQEDWELQRATKISLGQDPGPVPPAQQTGIVDDSGETHFGPATKAQYDESRWALTRVGTTQSTVEIAEHPENPFERKRDDANPAVLSPVSRGEQGFKPALITILHSIPAARNALIFPSYQQEDLGQAETWYQGDHISQGIIMQDLSNLQKQDLDLIFEIQRLMAFLDESERTYARPKHLADILDSRESPIGEYAKVLDQWLNVAEKIRPDLGRRKLFTTRVIYTTKERESDYEDVVCFRLELEGPIQNIYEKLNSMLWPSTDRQAFVRDVSDIICVDIRQKSSGDQVDGLGLSVPPTIFLDRYLERNLNSTQSIHENIRRHEMATADLKERLDRILWYSHPTSSETIAATGLLQNTISFMKAGAERQQTKNLDLGSGDAGRGQEADPHNDSTIKELEEILDFLKQKIDGLTQQIEKHQEAIQQARAHLMQEDWGNAQHYRYSLRGVCVDGKKIFVLQPSKPNSAAGSWTSSIDENGFQWWCQDFSWSSTKDFGVSKVPIDDVINEASNNGKSVLLVYANDRACLEPSQPLPIALHNFVAQDNLLFDRELQSHAHYASSRMDWEAVNDNQTSGFGISVQSEDPNVQHVEQVGHHDPEITTSAPPHSKLVSQLRSPETGSESRFSEDSEDGGSQPAHQRVHGLPNLRSDFNNDESDGRWLAAQQGQPFTKEDAQALQEEHRRLGRDLTLKESREFMMRWIQGASEGAGTWGDVDMDDEENAGWKGG